jgi:hypothetical protein
LTYTLLKPELEAYKTFEIKLSPSNRHIKHQVEKTITGEEVIIPPQDMLRDRRFLRALKREKERTNKNNLLLFESIESCDQFVEKFEKHNGFEYVNFKMGLEYVNQVFLEKTIDDINRYIVGWWS